MALTKEQRKVAKTLIRVGKRKGESPKDIVTALATGLVESNLTNIRGGEGSSSGWRQETAESYPNVNRNNVRQSAARFYDELNSAGSGSIGTRAQAVQRSAYPGRYGERVDEARGILKALNRGGLGGRQAGAQRSSAGGRLGGKTVTIPGVNLEDERKVAALDFIKNRFKPGAIEAFATQKQELQDVPSKTISLGKGKPVKANTKLPSAKLPASQHLHGGAIDIGTKVAKKFGLTVTSTTGGSHVAGSYHYSGRAIDISGSPAAMRKAYKYLQKNLPHGKLTELFYDPIGHYWDNGQKINGAIGGHSDHLHLAI